MKIKEVLYWIYISVIIYGGALLCSFAEPLKSRLFNCIPIAVTMMVCGFLGWITAFAEYIVDYALIRRSQLK